MLLPSDITYYDFDTIAALSGKGWPVGDYFRENLLESHDTMLRAIEKACSESKPDSMEG